MYDMVKTTQVGKTCITHFPKLVKPPVIQPFFGYYLQYCTYLGSLALYHQSHAMPCHDDIRTFDAIACIRISKHQDIRTSRHQNIRSSTTTMPNLTLTLPHSIYIYIYLLTYTNPHTHNTTISASASPAS